MKKQNPRNPSAVAALCHKLRNPPWPESIPLPALESMAEAARGLESMLAEARGLVAGLMADLVAQPEPGNPHRLDSVQEAVAYLESVAEVPGGGYDSGWVFRARLAAGTLGGRFKAPFLGADLEPLGRAVETLAEATRAHAGTLQTLGRCRAGLRLEGAGSGWTPSDLETLAARARREKAQVAAARAAWLAEVAAADLGGRQ